MSREVKRVALDFNWQVGKGWDGYLNPHYRACPQCEAGYSPAYRAVQAAITPIMWGGRRKPCAELDKITTFLSGREPHWPLGHDSCDMWSAVKKLGELAGLPDGWDVCQQCDGDGVDPSIRSEYEAWKPTDPPAGEGWQMWETTSEGSPISPVFETPETLARWLAVTNASAFGDSGATYEQWLATIHAGWAPSAVGDSSGLRSGVAFVGDGEVAS